ncbi:ChaN family lipoprotein [Aestuariicella hydrocarbonica]|uniref:ChaN family lipoprotein n=1 Tax=Pseudomaricurvus hydrocarbonicus TaxID=1470433 RepID=A0A9E5JXY4_9GAMM|nr:ChaN family lipoprotein [Aestuariicella hydrocarbonica]NHO66615.1 ChaN family lipoprotein [Aestuariicella hydrocarbonica]
MAFLRPFADVTYTMMSTVAVLMMALLWVNTGSADAWKSPLLQDHPLVGKIVEQKTGRELSFAELVTRLTRYPVILIGEKHDNPDHHVFESQLLSALVDAETAVVFEMLDDQQRSALNSLPAELSLETLKTQLQWPPQGWSWEDYGPLFLQVIDQGGLLRAGNIDRPTMMNIYRKGVSSLMDQPRFASIASLQQDLQLPILDLVFESHCGKMDKDKLQPMVEIQWAKDASMGFVLAQSRMPRSVMIAGAVHARKDIGIPRHLPTSLHSVTLLLREVAPDKLQADQYSAMQTDQAGAVQADYVWFSPMATDEDYCDRL